MSERRGSHKMTCISTSEFACMDTTKAHTESCLATTVSYRRPGCVKMVVTMRIYIVLKK